MYQVLHTFIVELILIKFFFSFLEFMALWMTTFYGPQVAQINEDSPMKSSLIWQWHNILVMKIPNRKRCAIILKLNPVELGIIAFFQTLAPWSFCCKSISLLVMNLKSYVKVVTKLKTLLSLHGLQLSMLDTIVGCVVRFVDYLLIARRTT
jgi:hypothetical protein